MIIEIVSCWKVYELMIQLRQFILFCCIFLLTFSCSKKNNPSSYQSDTTTISQSIKVDQDVIDIITPYKDMLDEQMNEVIGVFAHDMYKGELPEGELGNFMSDAPFEYIQKEHPEYGPIDFGMTNFGGIRSQHIPAGEVTVEQMFELMPFENEMVIVEVSGEVLKQMMATIAETGGWPISKNVNLLIENQTISQFLINGEAVDWDKPLRVLTTDYVANGGSGMDMLEEIEHIPTGLLMRDVLIDYIRWKSSQDETISNRVNGRVIVINEK